MDIDGIRMEQRGADTGQERTASMQEQVACRYHNLNTVASENALRGIGLG